MELYNQIEKEEFMETIESEDIKRLYQHLFSRSKNTEELYKKDLYQFTLAQIEDVMRSLNPSTMNSVANNKSRIGHYIVWAINNGRRFSNISPLQGTTAEWGKKFIDKTVKRHLTDVELYDIIEDLDNAQDQALLQCLFEGIMGEGLSEILSMNAKNIDWDNNIITVRDSRDGKQRKINVSDRCMKFINNAYNQTIYVERSGHEKELIEHEGNIFKNIKWRTTKHQGATRGFLAKKINKIKEYYELDDFTALRIHEAGRIKMAADLGEKTGAITKKEFEMIGDRFNLPMMESQNYMYYNTSIMKQIINSENLKEMYGVDIRVE